MDLHRIDMSISLPHAQSRRRPGGVDSLRSSVSLFVQVSSHMVDLYAYWAKRRETRRQNGEQMLIVTCFVCAYISRSVPFQDESVEQVPNSRFHNEISFDDPPAWHSRSAWNHFLRWSLDQSLNWKEKDQRSSSLWVWINETNWNHTWTRSHYETKCIEAEDFHGAMNRSLSQLDAPRDHHYWSSVTMPLASLKRNDTSTNRANEHRLSNWPSTSRLYWQRIVWLSKISQT